LTGARVAAGALIGDPRCDRTAILLCHGNARRAIGTACS
jgi:hypothetical protein